MTLAPRCFVLALGALAVACSTTNSDDDAAFDAAVDTSFPNYDSSSSFADSSVSAHFVDASVSETGATSDTGFPSTDAEASVLLDPDVQERAGEAEVDAGSEVLVDTAPTHCPELPSLEGVSIAVPTRTIGSTATYACKAGHTASGGSPVRTCQPSGSWSDQALICTPVRCAAPVKPTNGSVSYTDTGVGALAEYSCQPGTCLSGSAKMTCQADGSWSDTVPICMPGDCPVPAPPPPSCSGGAGAGSDCGNDSNDNCCSSPVVDAGKFLRTNDPNLPATVSRYRLDKYEVTVGRFRAFVSAGQGIRSAAPAAGAGANPHVPNSGWDPTWNDYLLNSKAEFDTALKCASGKYQTWSAGDDHRAINCVTWLEAVAFCIWDGGRLASELEWMYAAAGGDEQRLYPWGDEEPGTDNALAVYGCYYNASTPGKCNEGSMNIPAVGVAKGFGRWGHADLAGGMLEFGLDFYATPLPATCADCVNLTGTSRVELGGSYVSPIQDLRTTSRFRAYNKPLQDRSSATGFRCSREP